ncbi:hypothetical protein BK699_20345 [Bacillus thuringiensis serovar mexicanensis]|uniref:Uncharacterized protein n=1 Tax=Bacillus thuringiensis serovar mexicanensis TaxID=180868 RepID=A0A242W4P6_BACTU|nr:hypothetical protein BK699_20345 [Bacillus thuringiensis serovar mexicanensis]OTX00486.1 hypothetical protein BK705_19195 [Bacillus thuringiensis serovar monterrey]
MPNRNSSPTYHWATPFTRLRKENSFGEYVKLDSSDMYTNSYSYSFIFLIMCCSKVICNLI